MGSKGYVVILENGLAKVLCSKSRAHKYMGENIEVVNGTFIKRRINGLPNIFCGSFISDDGETFAVYEYRKFGGDRDIDRIEDLTHDGIIKPEILEQKNKGLTHTIIK